MSEKFRYKFEGIQRLVDRKDDLFIKKLYTHLLCRFRADSVTWNPHKLMNVLLQCSTVHFKQNVSRLEMTLASIDVIDNYRTFSMQSLLYHCNRMCADYLFQQDKHYDVTYDTGDKVIQCGRHNDIFKFWLLWRAKVSRALRSSNLNSNDCIL